MYRILEREGWDPALQRAKNHTDNGKKRGCRFLGYKSPSNTLKRSFAGKRRT